MTFIICYNYNGIYFVYLLVLSPAVDCRTHQAGAIYYCFTPQDIPRVSESIWCITGGY